MNEVREGTGPIEYVREKIPEFAIPEYDGQRYEAMVPDTLDLQERAELAVNGLTGPTDPQADYEIYWKVSFQSNPPWMQHDWSDGVQVKFMEALPLMRVISGSDLNQHVDHRWMEVALHTLGPDGLSYTPARGRPWARLDDAWGSTAADHFCIPSFNGRLISTMTIYHLRGSNPVWKEAIERMVQGLTALAVDKGSYAYFPEGVFSPDVPRSRDAEMPVAMQASLAGWVVQGLAQYYRISGHEPARELADKLTRYLQEHAGLFDTTEGFRFLPTNPGGLQNIHFHHHTNSLLAMAELALGTRNESLLEYVRQGYEYCKVNGNVLVGFFAEDIGSSDQETSEPCDIADMLAIGLKLTEAGAGDYWDDVDRWTRNQFVETQLLRTDWIDRMVENLPVAAVDKAYQTADGTPERNVGAFLSWPSPNDGFTGKRHGLGIMHCCTGNAARAIYYVWQNILRWEDGKLRVNLLLNRASAWADVDSHIPYEGRVDVKTKQACRLSVRIPEWVTEEEATCQVNGTPRPLSWDGRYANVGKVGPGDVATMSFPIKERSDTVHIEKQRYTLVRKGNDVVSIDPPGRYYPLYQRAHYLENSTRWKKTTRFVSDELLEW